ncbi:MAG TPA: polysaccharide deacetylase family protein, partial [Spirochaetota bacterium]|nr:polysaccharide deacetylase family protein [Spirochaetota bacterium]
MFSKNFKMLIIISIFSFISAYGAYTDITVVAVPWNNHNSAVSITFDDAMVSQRTNIIPYLYSEGIRATFFIMSNSGSIWENYNSYIPQWSNVASVYNMELGNHSKSHPDLSSMSGSELTNEILNWKQKLENDCDITVTSFAHPFCNHDSESRSVVAEGHFIARACGGDFTITFDTEPTNWMAIGSRSSTGTGFSVDPVTIVTNGTNTFYNLRQDLANNAAQGEWLPFYFHSVAPWGEGDDEYPNPSFKLTHFEEMITYLK